jgi:membrane protein implicated in regulation of membrane protease activity
MLTIYSLCFAIGGVFVLLAMLGGLDHFDVDYDFDHAADLAVFLDTDVEFADPGHDPQTAPNVPRRASRRDRFANRPRTPWGWLGIIQNLKFWTFGICFFGLTGLVLSNLSMPLPAVMVAIAAVIMGILCGGLVSGSLRALRRQQADSLIRSVDLVGSAGTVEVPFNASSRGKVRLQIKSSILDLIAYTDEAKEFQLGEQVLVVSTDQNRLWVVSADSLKSPRNEPSSENP